MISHNFNILVLTLSLATLASCAPKGGSKDDKLQNKTTMSNNLKPAETGYADVNGLKLYYEVYGQGKPLILLHGSFMTIPLNWSEMIPLLAGDRKVIVAEMQGHGRTRDTDRPMSYEGMADDVSALLQHLHIDSADVLGYSMGGGIAFQVAIRHPEQVRRLIILSGVYAHNGWSPGVEASLKGLTGDMLKGSPLQTQYDSFGNDPARFNDFVKKVISIDLKPYDWTKEVMQIKVPVFMAMGDVDGIRHEHALALFIPRGGGKMGDMDGMPQSRLAILPGTSHVGMIHRNNILVPMITDFLDSELKPGPPEF